MKKSKKDITPSFSAIQLDTIYRREREFFEQIKAPERTHRDGISNLNTKKKNLVYATFGWRQPRRSLQYKPETKSIIPKLPSSFVIIIKWRKISLGIDNEIILLLFARRFLHFFADSARSFRFVSGVAHPTLWQKARARGKRKTMPNAHNNSVFCPRACLVSAVSATLHRLNRFACGVATGAGAAAHAVAEHFYSSRIR